MEISSFYNNLSFYDNKKCNGFSRKFLFRTFFHFIFFFFCILPCNIIIKKNYDTKQLSNYTNYIQFFFIALFDAGLVLNLYDFESKYHCIEKMIQS